MAEAMQWRGKSTNQPMNKGWKETWTELKKRKPTLKQCPSRRRNKIQRIKTKKLTHATRVKQAPERVPKSNKPVGNGKRMNIRTTMDSYGSRACTQGSSTTYLYPANTGEVGHRSKVIEDMVWQWREGGAYFGVLAQALLGEISYWNH